MQQGRSLLLLSSLSLSAQELGAPGVDLRERKPLWELGFLFGAVYVPDYPSSDESHVRYLPLPYFRYRGEVFRADEDEGTRARLFKDANYDFDISAAAAFPVGRGDNRARRGMPELDWIGELGPRLIVEFPERPEFELYFPLRAVFTTDLSYAQYLGVKFSPGMGWSDKLWSEAKLGYILRWSFDFASNGVADRFYEVRPEFATSDRPQYDAHGGYMGSSLTGGVFRRGKTIEWFSAIQYTRYDGARNSESPLFRSHTAFSIFFGFAYLLYESEEAGHL